MPTPTTITIVSGRLAVGLTSDALTAFDCQVVSAAVTANANLQTVKATFCSPESQVPAATGFELWLNFLQDWTDPAGVCWFSMDNDTAEVAWELSLDAGDGTSEAIMHGMARVVALGFGGDAGTPLESSSVWPVIGKPTKGAWPPAGTRGVDEDVEPVGAVA